MAAIAYDKPVTNLISQLSATKHVTHSRYTKKSVTLHHNGGNLTHGGVLSVWKTRPASAHFDVDAKGAVAQYVQVDEYAWAVGNTKGNQETISIEMANCFFAPNWEVSDTTWKSAARLSGWLFAHEIGARPTKSNFKFHSDWSSTACPGPYVKKIFDQILKAAQEAYDDFKGKKDTPAQEPSGHDVKSVREVASEVIAGKWGVGTDRVNKLKKAGYNAIAVQDEVNRQLQTSSKAHTTKSVEAVAKEVIAGKWGVGSDRVTRLKNAGYNPTSVQNEVNKQLKSKAPAKTTTPKKSVSAIAKEVIAGKWGNGDDRTSRLKKAGYDAKAVQTEVNRQLR